MYVQSFLLCETIYVNEEIYQNVCMGIHKTGMKVLMEWYGSVFRRPIMWVCIDILSLGVSDAIAHFNDGANASLEILKNMDMEPNDHIMKGLEI